jgi:hypothetical protein
MEKFQKNSVNYFFKFLWTIFENIITPPKQKVKALSCSHPFLIKIFLRNLAVLPKDMFHHEEAWQRMALTTEPR